MCRRSSGSTACKLKHWFQVEVRRQSRFVNASTTSAGEAGLFIAYVTAGSRPMSTRRANQVATPTRLNEVKALLENRRDGLKRDLQHRIREVRIDAAADRHGLDEAES